MSGTSLLWRMLSCCVCVCVCLGGSVELSGGKFQAHEGETSLSCVGHTIFTVTNNRVNWRENSGGAPENETPKRCWQLDLATFPFSRQGYAHMQKYTSAAEVEATMFYCKHKISSRVTHLHR